MNYTHVVPKYSYQSFSCPTMLSWTSVVAGRMDVSMLCESLFIQMSTDLQRFDYQWPRDRESGNLLARRVSTCIGERPILLFLSALVSFFSIFSTDDCHLVHDEWHDECFLILRIKFNSNISPEGYLQLLNNKWTVLLLRFGTVNKIVLMDDLYIYLNSHLILVQVCA